LPHTVVQAAVALSHKRPDTANAGMWLWLPNSWATAQRIGISSEEYARWVSLGLWNFDGSPGVFRIVKAYRELAGEQAWILAAAGYTPEDATVQVSSVGAAEAIESAEALIALKGLADMLPEAERWETEYPEETERDAETGPIDFR